jgi:farnesyl-diphosphate farnesyltransferase
LLRALLTTALEHYDEGWRYTLAIPRREWRMRLACAWPLLIGLATLGEIAAHPDPLTVSQPIKVSRATVRRILARSALAVGSNRALAAQGRHWRVRVHP